MQAQCQPDIHTKIDALKPCLDDYGLAIAKDCEQICGDYDSISHEIQRLSQDYTPGVEDTEKISVVLQKIDEGCLYVILNFHFCIVQNYYFISINF